MTSGAEKANSRLLVLVAHHPPMPRILKLCEDLPEHRWDVVLAVPRSGDGDYRFVAAKEDVPAAEVHEIWLIATPSATYRRLAQDASIKPQKPAQTIDRAKTRLLLTALAERLRRITRSALLWIDTPDELVGWIPFAAARGRKLARAGEVDAILASGPPFSVVVAGALVKRMTGLPLIADFRDPWTLDPNPLGAMGAAYRADWGARRVRALEALESWCLGTADLTLFTADSAAAAYKRKYPFLEGRTRVVYNGVDAEDFAVAPEVFEGFAVVSVGTLHDYDLPALEALFRAVRSGRERGVVGMRVVLAGLAPPQLQARILAAAEREDVGDMLTLLGVVPHDRAIALMRGAAINLVMRERRPLARPSKLSEMLAAGRPVLAIAEEHSTTGDEITAAGHTVVDGSDPAAIEEYLIEQYRAGSRPLEPAAFPFCNGHGLSWRTNAAVVSAALADLG